MTAPLQSRAWTPAEEDTLVEMRVSGADFKQISAAINRRYACCVTRYGEFVEAGLAPHMCSKRLAAARAGTLPPMPAATLPKRNKTRRTCLCCGRVFDSSGPGNRLCKTCRHKDPGPFAGWPNL